MPCELRLGGSSEAVQKFVARGFLPTDAVFEESINICVSDADFDDLQGQIEETIAFLERVGEQLHEVCEAFGINEGCLDFGVAQQDTFVQGFYFPAGLLFLAGKYGFDIEVSMYPISKAEESDDEFAA